MLERDVYCRSEVEGFQSSDNGVFQDTARALFGLSHSVKWESKETLLQMALQQHASKGGQNSNTPFLYHSWVSLGSKRF